MNKNVGIRGEKRILLNLILNCPLTDSANLLKRAEPH
jgi:hypothetical protein